MRAVIAPRPGGPEALQIVDRPVPEPLTGEVLIRVAAAGVNRADLLQRQGHYSPPPGATDVLGLECAGTIEAIGDGVAGFDIGQRVCALLSGGGYADYVTVPAGQVAPLPEPLTDIEAGSIMEVAATVWSNVFMTARLRADELLLVHGGSSGIGTMAIQLAKAFGAQVAVTAGTEPKLDACRRLGADVAINYRERDFAEELKELGRRPDVILDNMGAKYLARNVAALNTGGRLVVIGLQGGVKGELNLGALLAKRGSVTATSLRARPVDEKSAIVADLVEHVWPLFGSQTLRPIVHAQLPLDDVAEAHMILEESSHIGKVVLTFA